MNRRTHSLLTAGLVFCVGVLLSSLAGWGFKQRIESEAADHFAFVCDQITQSIHRRLEAVELVLRGGAAVFAASETVDRHEWKSYVDTLQAMNELPGLRGVGFAEHLPFKLIDRHHATVRADGFPDYAIHPADEARTVFAPVTYIEPFSASNRQSLGFDLLSIPETRSAMEKACDTSDAALTGQLRLPLAGTEGEKRNGALMFIPVYRKDAPKGTFDERRQALIGWTFSSLLQDDLINGILEPWDQQEGATLDLEIRDGLDRASATQVFDSKTEHTAAPDSLFYESRIIDFNGRQWLLEFDRTTAAGVDYAPVWLVLGGGLGLSGLLFALLLSILNTRTRALLIAEQRTREIRERESELRESEKKLSTVLDNVESLIYLKDTEGRYLFANKRALELYGTTVEQLIGLGDEQFFDEDAVARIRQNDYPVLESGQTVRTEEFIRSRRTGLDTTYYSVKVPLRDEDGRIYALCGISTDITEIKRVTASLLEEQKFSKLLLDSLPGIFYLYSYPDLRLLRWNRQHETLLGFSQEEMPGRHITEWYFPGSEDALLASVNTAMQTGEGSVDATLRAKDGSPVHFLLTGVKFETPEQTYLMGIGIDTSWRKQAEDQLKLAASVFAHAREGIMITDPEGQIIDVNEAFTRITGYSREEALGRNPRFLNSGRQDRAFYTELWRSLIDDGHWHGEIWNRRKDGDLYAEMQNISTVYDAQGKPSQYVALFSDITAIKEHEQKLEHIAHYDVLTTLPNRTLLADRLHQAMAQAQRRDSLLAVAYLDLDGFKTINDRHGHETGDLLLLALAGRMKDALREGDTLARMGGDEFVAVLLDLADAAASLPMLNRLLTAAAQPIAVGDLVLQVSASLGVTFYPQSDEVDADQLLRQADQAMYQAKLAGKNRYHLFDADQDRNVRGLNETLQQIRSGIGNGEFVMHFQPKVNMRSGAVIGAEALIRWQHPEKGLLPPLEFLPLIEDHPLAVELGEWVIDAALKHREDWLKSGLDLPVSVNIGARQLQHAHFVERLKATLAQRPSFKPGDLEMEVLETSALKDLERVARIIEACREIGVEFSLDDFGTGYSSLTYLKRLSVKRLKIDQSFVRHMLDDPDDLAILEGILGLATAFRRKVIAEGVETVEHGEMLLQLGCDTAQGYGIARPMPADQIPAWAAAWLPFEAWKGVPIIRREDLPLLYAGTEQRAWLATVEAYLAGEREAPPLLDLPSNSACAWLRGEGHQHYCEQPAFQSVERQYRKMHALVQQLCGLQAAGKANEVGNRLPEFRAARDALLEQMKQLSRSPLH